MKITLVFLVLLIAGCATRSIEIAPIKIDINMDLTGPARAGDTKPNPIWETLAKKTIGEDSVIGQITLGCLSYRQVADRWPQTKEELAEGLTTGKLPSNRLSELQKITFKEENETLLVEFVASGKVAASGTLRLNSTKKEDSTSPTKDLHPD